MAKETDKPHKDVSEMTMEELLEESKRLNEASERLNNRIEELDEKIRQITERRHREVS
ncbi:MAG TPA: hypothetical protein VHD56_11925 [Tepidisphaeraceae bacterium]|nr:hypothetical protein [Tepidisphaeraceae bacterium]